MNKKDIIEKVAFLKDKEKIAAKLYFHYNDGEDKLLEAPTNNESVDKKLATNYSNSVQAKFKEERDFKILNIEKVEEFDTKATHYYYENNYPDELCFLFIDKDEKFRFNNHDYKKIKGYLIDLTYGNENILLYKYRHNYDIHIKPTLLTMVRVDNELTSPSHESIIINENFDYVITGDYLIAMSLNTLERKIKFEKRIKQQSEEIIESIKENGKDLVEGVEKLKEYLDENFNFAKKMKAIDFGGVLWNTPFQSVRTKIESYPNLKSIMKFKGSKFNITSKQAARIFFKLCNDEVMESILSGDVSLVDGIETIENQN